MGRTTRLSYHNIVCLNSGRPECRRPVTYAGGKGRQLCEAEGERFFREAKRPAATSDRSGISWSQRQDLNLQPAVYKTAALPLRHAGKRAMRQRIVRHPCRFGKGMLLSLPLLPSLFRRRPQARSRAGWPGLQDRGAPRDARLFWRFFYWRGLVCPLESTPGVELFRPFPIDDAPPCFDVVGPFVFVVEVVGMLPYVKREQGLRLPDAYGRVLVGCRQD